MTTFRKLFIVMAVFIALGIVSCRNNSSGTEEPSVTNVPVKGISFEITGDTVDVPGGTTKQIVVIFDPPNATNKKLTWNAEMDGVVTIDDAGNVTAVTHKNNDSTKITATSEDGNFTAECTVNVPVKKITSVTLPPIVYGDMFKGVQLTAKIEPEDASYQGVKWDSSDSSKISVDTLGNVRFYGNKFDEVTITATTDEGNHTATSRVIAIEAPKVDLIEDPKAGSLGENDVSANFVRIGPCAMPLGENGSWNVTITRTYEISDHEVTQAEWEKYFTVNPSKFKADDSGENHKKCPVETVNFFAAIAYCNKRSIDEDLTPCYSVEGVTNWIALKYDIQTNWKQSDIPYGNDAKWYAVKCDFNANGYRLPTEAEWEIAARAPIDGVIYGGVVWPGTTDANEVGKYAWNDKNNTDKTHEVKQKLPNEYGLYDMSGNVYELCWDWFDSTAPTGEVTDPVGPSPYTTPEEFAGIVNGLKLQKGGSYTNQASGGSVSYRNNGWARGQNGTLGFRVVRTVSN